MSYLVTMRVTFVDERWGVDIFVNQAFHDRMPADSEDEAKRMLVDLVDMAVETGGKLDG